MKKKNLKNKAWFAKIVIALILGAGLFMLARVLFVRYNTHFNCSTNTNVQVWLDENANGVMDSTEPPLPGVGLIVGDRIEEHTDWNGEAHISLSYGGQGGCPYFAYDITAENLPNHQLTTAQTISTNSREFRDVTFGYTYLEGVPTVTPRPPTLSCIAQDTHSWGIGSTQAIAVHPDTDIVWIGAYGGIVLFDPRDESWKKLSSEPNPIPDINSIDIAPSGDVWLASYDGDILRYQQGQIAQSFSITAQFPDHKIRDLKYSADGILWIGTSEGIVAWQTETDEWVKYTIEDGLGGNSILDIEIDQEGTIWVLSSGAFKLSFLKRDLNTNPTNQWEPIRDLKDTDGRFMSPNNSLFFSNNGTILWADLHAYKDPQTGEWHRINYPYTFNNAIILDDGRAWAATRSHLAYIPDVYNQDIATTRIFDSRYGLSEPHTLALENDTAIWVGDKSTADLARCLIPEGFYD